jgi:hypothetical protein
MRFRLPYLFDHLWTVQLMTWGTLFMEFSLCFLVWVKPLRYLILSLGVLFHMGLNYALNIPLFQPIMVACYVNFIDAAALTRAMSVVRSVGQRLIPTRLTVAYDGRYDLSCRVAETVRRLDIFGLVLLLDTSGMALSSSIPAAEARQQPACPQAPGLFIERGGAWVSGAFAARAIAWRLPLIALFYPLLLLPVAPRAFSFAGEVLSRTYRHRLAAAHE